MDLSQGQAGGHPAPELSDLARLAEVRAELGELEAIAREIADLTALLRARLAPDQFRLAWALREAVERLAVAEELLRARRLADTLARHVPAVSPELQAMRRRILGAHPALDEAG